MVTRLTFPLAAAFALLAGGAPAYANIVIDPFFESSITGDPNASTIEGTIDSAIAFYEANISTPITVKIAFEEGGGLGESDTYIGTVPYLTYITDLHAASSGDATDTTALAGLPITATNPVNGGATITAKLANLNAVGIATPGAFPDLCPGGTGSGNFNACITLNTGITFPPQPNNGSNFSLLSVTEHEIDEVLGLGSGLSCSAPGAANCTVGTPNPEDLFRYTTGGTRSYSLNPQTSDACTGAPAAEFSLNGTTDLKQFNNCDNGGDYGDWADNGSPAAVQDAFGTPGASTSLTTTSPEVVALDAIGYNLVTTVTTTPEPGTLALLGTSLLGLAALRRRRT